MMQVVIVGAGPTGATLALLLVKRGVSVTLIEATKDFHRVFRGEGLMPSGLEALEQMDLYDIIQQIPHRPLTGWEFIIGNTQLFRVDEPMGASRPCALVSQPHLLEALVAQAREHNAFELIQGVPVKDVLRQQNRIVGVTLSDGRNITADLVIGADGRNSLIRQRAELPLVKQPHAIDILWFKLLAHPRFVKDNVFCTILKDGAGFSIVHGAEAGKLHLAWILATNDAVERENQDWGATFASLSPPWLAEHFCTHADTIESPLRLSVMVGRCPQWGQPGVLLLGDAAHPMSPVRAQGINLALRDVIVAANYLVPLLQGGANPEEMDLAWSRIQAEREPEIIRAQYLQEQEARQGELLKGNVILRSLVSNLTPLVRPGVRYSWVRRQQAMRQGVTQVNLKV